VNITIIRLKTLIQKELRMIFGDRQSLRLMIMPVIMQLLLFPFAATLEVKSNAIAILDQDGGRISSEIKQRLSNTPSFKKVFFPVSDAEARDLVNRQSVLLLLRIDPRFSESVASGKPLPIQAIIDGRRSNSGQIAISYVQQILAGIGLKNQSIVSVTNRSPITVRHWYNVNLDYYRFVVPSLVAIMTTLSALIVTALSVAREREQGTLDQLLVSPLKPRDIFIGKAIPALFVAAMQATIILAGGILGYGIAFQGSFLLLYGCLIAYVAALVGVGLFLSSLCQTQQQAFLGVFIFMMPSILLSGYVTPIDNMPHWMQIATWANPVRHFILIVKSVYLKGATLGDFYPNVLALLAIAVVTGGVGLTVFKRSLT
jgi:ABC-2 type transport system permease protein